MKPFPEKLKEARIESGMTQIELGEAAEISQRAIAGYEKGEKKPRQAVMLRLAKALNVSVKFLTDPECEDPMEDIEKDGYITEARERYGSVGAKDMDRLLSENRALFAGGELSPEQKDAFFSAVLEAYVACRNEAKDKFGKKKPE